MLWGKRTSLVAVGTIALTLIWAVSARAQTSGRPPDLMKLPGIINLGATTFLDGFLPTDPGCAYFQYLRRNYWDEIHDKDGKSIPAFGDLKIATSGAASQLACSTPVQVLGGALGFHTIVAVAELDSSADPTGIQLQDNRTGFGDIFFATYLQMPPIVRGGRVVYSQRFDLTIIAPAGKFDSNADLNQSSGYWSVNPYWAATWFPFPKWELTWRAHYLYNFESDKIASSQIPNVRRVFRSGQAGQAAWVNFTLGYAFTDRLSAGLTGYYLKQLTDDELNGRSYSGGKEEALYMGPGVSYKFNADNIVNVNVYFPVEDRNRPSGGLQLNAVYAHVF